MKQETSFREKFAYAAAGVIMPPAFAIVANQMVDNAAVGVLVGALLTSAAILKAGTSSDKEATTGVERFARTGVASTLATALFLALNISIQPSDDAKIEFGFPANEISQPQID